MNSSKTISRIGEIKPMSNLTYHFEEWLLFVWDIFLRHPGQDLEKLPLKEGMTVVDYGCGPGHYTIPAAETVTPKGHVYAVEIQPLALETIKKKAAQKSLENITPVLVDSYNTGIPDASTDVVLLIDVLHMISDHDSLFLEIFRLLKPDRFLFMDPGHMKAEVVKNIVDNTGLFNLVRFDGRNTLLTKKSMIKRPLCFI